MEDIPENESLEDILYGTRQCKCGEKYTSGHVYVKLLPRYIMFDKYVENSITITTKERSTRIVLYESVPSRFKTFNNMNSDSSFHYNYNYKYVGENDDYYDEIWKPQNKTTLYKNMGECTNLIDIIIYF